jgi:hypothetical protein
MNASNSNKGLLLTGVLAAAAIACSAPGSARATAPLTADRGSYAVEVLVDGHQAAAFEHRGETVIMGQHGQRYTLRVHNRTGRRIEAVVSVDGLDVVDGKSADFNKRGYLVGAWGSVDIDGWRLSQYEAATFRFGSVSSSYAASKGKARNVGVIGVAVFPERVYPPRPIYRPTPVPYGYRRDEYAPSRSYEESDDKDVGAARGGASQGAPASAPADVYAESKAEAAEALGSSSGMRKRSPAQNRPGLGTEFGEAVGSQVHEVEFVRANGSYPALTLGMRYNDRSGLIAMGVDVDGPYYSDIDLRETAEPFPVSTRQYARPPRHWNGR